MADSLSYIPSPEHTQTFNTLHRMVFAILSDAVFILDAEITKILDCNPTASNIFGYSREEMLGQTTTFLHTDADALEEFRSHLYPAINEKGFLSHYELTMKRKDGTIFPAEKSVVPLGDPQAGHFGWVSMVHDISDRKLLEKKLQAENKSLELQVANQTRESYECEQIQHAILEATDQSIMMTDLNGNIILANEVAAKRFNMVVQDFLGVCIFDLMPSELARSRNAIGEKIVVTGKPIRFNDERGGIWFESTAYPVYDPNGQVDRLVLFARDITTQKRTEIALKESEEKYRMLAEAAHDMIFVITEDDQIEYVNSHAAGFFNLRPEAIIGKQQSSLFPPTDAKRQREGIVATLASGSPKYSENWLKFGKGEAAFINTWLVPLSYLKNGKRSVLGISRDITILRRIQDELESSKKQLERRVDQRTKELANLSTQMRKLAKKLITAQEEERRRISRELHDDTGQVLITLKYTLADLLNELSPDQGVSYEKVSDSIKAVDEAMTSIRSIAHSLRPSLLDVGGLNVSLKDFCQDINHCTKIEINYIGMELDNLPDEIAITLYRYVQEAFTNILKHSQATRVSVKLKFIHQRIILSVSDNGIGIRDHQDTTGIGLIGLRERIDSLGGKLQIETAPGKGTNLKASIPWKVTDIEA